MGFSLVGGTGGYGYNYRYLAPIDYDPVTWAPGDPEATAGLVGSKSNRTMSVDESA